MVTFTRFFLLHLHLLAYVYANGEYSSGAVKWLEAERSVLVHLATPDLHYWNERRQIGTRYPGAFIFNFTLASNHILLLNDEPILPRAHPYSPAPLRAHQTGESATQFAHQLRTKYSGASVMDLDYYIETPDTTSGTSIYNTKYNPRIRIDILRANIRSLPGYSAPLSSNIQNQIWVFLEDLSAHPPNTPYSSIPLKISNVNVARRWQDVDTNGTTTYKTIKSLKTCHIWSWLCADIREYPYYEYIYRENFDRYGKKGSMRHFLTSIWGSLVGLVGNSLAIVLLAVCESLALLLAVYAVFKGVKSVIEMYRRRVQEVDEWVADEEVEGLLEYDRYIEDFVEVENEDLAEGKGHGKTRVEEFLPPPPPYTPMKTDDSSGS